MSFPESGPRDGDNGLVSLHVAICYPTPIECNKPHATSATVPRETVVVEKLLGALRTGPFGQDTSSYVPITIALVEVPPFELCRVLQAGAIVLCVWPSFLGQAQCQYGGGA